MYCKNCGKQISSDAFYCKHCGAKQDSIESEKTDVSSQIWKTASDDNNEKSSILETKKKQDLKKRLGKYLFWMLLAIIICLILFLCFKKSLSSPAIAEKSIDKVSKELAEACKRYDMIFSFHDGLACVRKKDKYGFIDKKGNEVIPCVYDMTGGFKLGYCEVTKSEKEGIINRNGEIVVPIEYESASINTDTTFSVRKYDEDLSGVINPNGDIVIPFDYLWCDSYTEGFYIVKSLVDGKLKYGLVNKSTKQLLNSEYFDDISGYGFHDNLCSIKIGDDWKYIDKSGKIAIEIDSSKSNYKLDNTRFWCGFTRVSTDFDYDNTQFAFINEAGVIVTDFIYGIADPRKAKGCYWIVETDPLHGKRGIMKITSMGCEWVIPAFYQAIYMTTQSVKDNIAFVERDHGTWYIINLTTGKTIVSVESKVFPYTYSEGLFLIKKNGLYGWMNTDSIVIPCIYNDTNTHEGFSEGFAVVNKFGVWGYVDKYGNDTFGFSN